jgi:hypothetical protein
VLFPKSTFDAVGRAIGWTEIAILVPDCGNSRVRHSKSVKSGIKIDPSESERSGANDGAHKAYQ